MQHATHFAERVLQIGVLVDQNLSRVRELNSVLRATVYIGNRIVDDIQRERLLGTFLHFVYNIICMADKRTGVLVIVGQVVEPSVQLEQDNVDILQFLESISKHVDAALRFYAVVGERFVIVQYYSLKTYNNVIKLDIQLILEVTHPPSTHTKNFFQLSNRK